MTAWRKSVVYRFSELFSKSFAVQVLFLVFALLGQVICTRGQDSILYATDFESADGFMVGFLGTQNGWICGSASQARPEISSQNAYSGVQHLRLSQDGSISQYGVYTGSFTPTFRQATSGRTLISFNLFINRQPDFGRCLSERRTDCGSTFHVELQSLAQAKKTAVFYFGTTDFGARRTIEILTAFNTFDGWADTGVEWSVGQYAKVAVDVDVPAHTISYFYNDALIFTGGFPAATAVDRVLFYRDNLDERLTFDIDSLRITDIRGSDDDRFEPNDTPNGAHEFGELRCPVAESNLIGGSDDWFKFITLGTGTADSVVSVSHAHEQGDLDLEIYSATNLVSAIRKTSGSLNLKEVTLLGLQAGTYYIRVFPSGGKLNPSYTLSIIPPASAIKVSVKRVIDNVMRLGVEGPSGNYVVQQGFDLATWSDSGTLMIDCSGRREIDLPLSLTAGSTFFKIRKN